jgi:hypothetical protein
MARRLLESLVSETRLGCCLPTRRPWNHPWCSRWLTLAHLLCGRRVEWHAKAWVVCAQVKPSQIKSSQSWGSVCPCTLRRRWRLRPLPLPPPWDLCQSARRPTQRCGAGSGWHKPAARRGLSPAIRGARLATPTASLPTATVQDGEVPGSIKRVPIPPFPFLDVGGQRCGQSTQGAPRRVGDVPCRG